MIKIALGLVLGLLISIGAEEIYPGKTPASEPAVRITSVDFFTGKETGNKGDVFHIRLDKQVLVTGTDLNSHGHPLLKTSTGSTIEVYNNSRNNTSLLYIETNKKD